MAVPTIFMLYRYVCMVKKCSDKESLTLRIKVNSISNVYIDSMIQKNVF